MDKGFKKWISSLSTQEKIEIAQQSLHGAHQILEDIAMMNANNKFVIYSEMLSSQIPLDDSAHAFNMFRKTLLEMALIRVCSLWDPEEEKSYSIPTLYAMICEPDVSKDIYVTRTENFKKYGIVLVEGSEEEKEYFAGVIERRRKGYADRLDKSFNDLAGGVATMLKSDMLKEARNYRHKGIAHAIPMTRDERNNGPVPLPKIGYEEEILDKTLQVVQNLDFLLFGWSTNWQSRRDRANSCAEMLWGRFKMNAEPAGEASK